MEKRLLACLSALLFFFLGWLLYNLGLLPVGPSSVSLGPPIGEVYEIRNQVRRRGLSSLVWEESRQKTPVYHRDTLLTLEKSGAHIRLHNDVELQLSQNTLVVIEAVDSKTHEGEIRLKFQKGNLRSRNEQRDMVVESEEFTLHAQAGSQVEIQSLGDDQFEISVDKGEAILRRSDEAVEIKSGELLSVENSTLQAPFQRTEDLKVVLEAPHRVYTHELPLPTQVAWEGSPDFLEVLTPNQPVQSYPLEGLSQIDLHLSEGQHSLRVRQGQQLSAPARLEVLQAPRIHLLSPRPRDRLLVRESYDFVWLSPVDLKSYKLKIHNAEIITSESQSATHRQIRLQGEQGRKAWGVVGVDSEGIEIPSLYHAPFYLAPALLEAPELKAPRTLPLRAPAKENPPPKEPPPSTSIWPLIWRHLLPVAHASEPAAPPALTLVFEWTDVEGADFYTIEISRRDDFHELLVESEANQTQWRWTTEAMGEVYWRVAGGSRAGALGKFSPPEKLNLDEIRQHASTRQITPSVKVEKPALAKPASPPPAKKEKQPELVPPAPEPMGPPPPRTYYAYTLGFQGFTQRATVEDQAADGTLTSLTGFQHPGFMIYGLYHFAPKRSLGLKARSIEYDWTEKITAESLQWSETEASFFANFGWATLSVDHFQSAKILRPLPQQQSVQDIELLGASLGMQQRFLKVFQGSTSVGYASGGDTSQTHWQLELTAFWPWSSTLSLETGVSFRRVLRQGGGLSHHAQEMRFFIGTPLKFGLRQE